MLMKTTDLRRAFTLGSSVFFLSMGLFAKCNPPTVHVDVMHQGVLYPYANERLNDGYNLTFGTIFLDPGDSVRISAIGLSYCTSFLVEHDEDQWISQNMVPFTPLMVTGVGLWTMIACGENYCDTLNFTIALNNGTPHPVALSVRMRLGGAQRGSNVFMGTELAQNGYVPLGEPYSNMGFMPPGTGGESTTSTVLGADAWGQFGIVDWVVIDLRDAVAPYPVVTSRCGLLHRDGTVTDVDGISPLQFNVASGMYHVAARHRNHLGVMTDQPKFFAGGITGVPFDQPSFSLFGTNARMHINAQLQRYGRAMHCLLSARTK